MFLSGGWSDHSEWSDHPPLRKTKPSLDMNTHTRQHDQSDCGVACLQSALKHFGARAVSFERLRELSGTSRQGTTMLGLLQAAHELGMDAQGYEATTAQLLECTDLCILHILKDGKLQHYVVYYGYDPATNTVRIGDPAEPQIENWSLEQLESVWQSKALLLLQPTDKLHLGTTARKKQWQWIMELVREDTQLLGLALALGIAVAILGLATAIFSQQLLDNILPSGDQMRLFTGAGLLLVLLLARGGLSYLRGLFLLRQSRDFNLRIVDAFYGRLLHLPKSFFDNRKTGDLIARMNDTRRIQRTVAYVASGLMIDFLLVLVASGAILWYDWRLGLVSLGWLPVFGWIVYRFHPRILQGQRQVMAAYANNESNYVDTMQGIGVIKVHNRQSVFARLTQSIYGLFQEAILSLGKVGLGYQLFTEIASAVFISGIILWSAWYVLGGQLSSGALIAILQFVGILMTSAAGLAQANIQLQEARVAFDRMYEFTSIDSEYDREAEQPQSVIQEFADLRVEHLRFRFPGRAALLEDVSFRVSRGEWITIMGESGCGKSTLLQILQKFYRPEAGRLKVNGVDLDLLGYEAWRGQLGVVPQEIKLFNGTLLDNILLGVIPDDLKELEQLLRHYGMDDYFRAFPNGYATIVGEEGINLSGGQRQMVALARALWQKPQLLLLDEPTAALDRDTEQRVLTLLQQLRKEAGIIVLTHRLSTARAADRIYVLENGRLTATGDHQQLVHADNLYARAWHDLVGA